MTIAVLVHALVFLAFWLTNLPYQETLNNFLVAATGLQANYLLFFMIFAGLMGLWSAARLTLLKNTRPAWFFLAAGIFFLVFFYGSFMVLFLKNPVQLYRLGEMLQYFRLFFDAALLLSLAWVIGGQLKSAVTPRKILGQIGLFGLWLLPLFFLPGNVVRGALLEKPRLIAHRGASTLAPENTLASMQKAASLGIYGLETDISISADGVPFLMHDDTLARTTDIRQVFPERRNDPAETFTWDELSRLDAGSWFGGWSDAPQEHIPTLKAMLQLVRDDDLHFIYDLRIPSGGHVYAAKALALCLEEIRATGVIGQTWVLAVPEAIGQIRSVLPDAILARGLGYTDPPPSPAALVADGYQVVNSAFSLSISRIHAYQEAGLWVNLWVVDEPWLFSRLWLAGADSVTSNNVQVFLQMSHPLLALPQGVYLVIWGILGISAVAVYWWANRRSNKAA